MKRHNYLLFFFLLAGSQNLLAQNINGYKVYVSRLYATTLYFHDAYTKYNFGEATCPYKFNSLLGDEKSIALETSSDVTAPYTLYVTEGGRKHKFTVIYKEHLEDAERDIYFTDLDLVAQLSKAPVNEPVAASPEPEPPKNEAPAAVQTAETADNNEAKYADLVRRANNAFTSSRYDDALKFYTAALALKPDDIYLNTQVQVIQKNIATAKIEEENRRKDSSFQSYINAGDKTLNDKQYNAARIAYLEALKIKPSDAAALDRLKKLDENIAVDSVKTVQQKKEALYANYVMLGDTAVHKKSYDAAKTAYNQALLIKPGDAAVAARLKNINQQIIADSINTVNRKNADLYAAYINSADKAFTEKTFGVAKSGYDSALLLKPGDVYANAQIKKIDDILAEQQRQARIEIEQQKNEILQKQYNDLISKADEAYKAAMYNDALEGYTKALTINKNDQYSKTKIAQIKKALEEKQLKLKQDSLNNIKYTAAIKKADDAFVVKEYITAKSLYNAALVYKTDDEYTNTRITEIEHILTEDAIKKQAEKDSINKINEINKKYTALITDAQKAYSEKDYTTARVMFSEAAGIKPDEPEARNKIVIIDSELAEIAQKQIIQSQADSLIANGEIAMATQLYPLALDNFKAAMALNIPEQQYYLQRQVSYIQDQLTILEKQRAHEALKQQFDSAMSAYEKGKDALKYKDNYEEVLFHYRKYLDIVGNMDSATLEQSQYNLVNITKYVRTVITNINDELERKSIAGTNKDTVRAKAPVAYAYYAPAIYYPNPKDPALGYVYRKYPDINFFSSPTDQKFDSLLNFNVQSNLIGREIMSLKPELELMDSSGNVKLICQNIDFKHNNVYFKFLVQNYDSTEFLTGRMLLSYKPRGSKDSIKLYPNYVASYPIILGGRQKVLVYVARPAAIADEENLRFELVDRLDKLKLEITIPGSAYNKEQGH
ncbi:hypothetical protein [Parafilimonas sp.]|uniref:hypothetical protein n=1 Tax=Parafilimonas sp. TaxID=1969739 RepID=UPI003F800BE1